MAFSAWRTWVTGEVVTAAHMNQEVRDNGLALFPQGIGSTTWTPVLTADTTNPTTSSATGHRIQLGGLQLVWARFIFSAAGSGVYLSDLPVAASGITGSGSQGSGQTIGSWTIRDDSGPQHASGSVVLRTSTAVWFHAADYLDLTLRHNFPFTVASGDVLSFFAMYPI